MEIEELLGYKFHNRDLLAQALTHSSYANEAGNPKACNERLEFLGDAVLDLVVAAELFAGCNGKDEGVLTTKKAKIVCEASLAAIGRKLHISDYMLFGHGEIKNGGKDRASIIADAMEAVIGAIYVDGGMAAAEGFVKRNFAETIANCECKELQKDPKTLFQETMQLGGACRIEYNLVRTFGPDHAKSFVVEVCVNGRAMGEGTGLSKKEAQRNAAQQALDKLSLEEVTNAL